MMCCSERYVQAQRSVVQKKLLEECNKLWDAPIEDAMPAAYPMQDFSAFRLLTKGAWILGFGVAGLGF